MYELIIIDTKTKQTIVYYNLCREEITPIIEVTLKTHYLNCYVVNFQNEKVKGYDFINGLERGK